MANWTHSGQRPQHGEDSLTIVCSQSGLEYNLLLNNNNKKKKIHWKKVKNSETAKGEMHYTEGIMDSHIAQTETITTQSKVKMLHNVENATRNY